MPTKSPDQAKRDHAHHNQWLEVAFEGDCEHGVHQDHDQYAAAKQGCVALGSFLGFTTQAVTGAGELGHQRRQDLRIQIRKRLADINRALVGICCDVDDALPVLALNARVARTQVDLGHLGKRNFKAAWRANP